MERRSDRDNSALYLCQNLHGTGAGSFLFLSMCSQLWLYIARLLHSSWQWYHIGHSVSVLGNNDFDNCLFAVSEDHDGISSGAQALSLGRVGSVLNGPSYYSVLFVSTGVFYQSRGCTIPLARGLLLNINGFYF